MSPAFGIYSTRFGCELYKETADEVQQDSVRGGDKDAAPAIANAVNARHGCCLMNSSKIAGTFGLVNDLLLASVALYKAFEDVEVSCVTLDVIRRRTMVDGERTWVTPLLSRGLHMAAVHDRHAAFLRRSSHLWRGYSLTVSRTRNDDRGRLLRISSGSM